MFTRHHLGLIYLYVAILLCAAPIVRLTSTGAARRPVVMVGGQRELLPAADWILSPGGGSTNAYAPLRPGDLESDTFNGLYITGSGGQGGITVSQTSTALPNPSWMTVNLSTEGTVDWIMSEGSNSAATSCSPNITFKAGVGNTLGCAPTGGIDAWVVGNGGSGYFVGTCTSCQYVFSYTASDQNTVNGSPGSSVPYRGWNGYPGPSTDQGWYFKAPARSTQLVLRQYLGFTYTTGAYCVGTLSDGSGTATTTPTISTVGTGSTAVVFTWTYHAATPNSTLLIMCHLGSPGSSGSGGSSITWYAETLGII